MTEDSRDQFNSSCVVMECSKHRCKTCRHISNSILSNVTGKEYSIISNNSTMSCETKSV